MREGGGEIETDKAREKGREIMINQDTPVASGSQYAEINIPEIDKEQSKVVSNHKLRRLLPPISITVSLYTSKQMTT